MPNHFAEIDNTVIMSKTFFTKYTNEVAEMASQVAIKEYKKQQLQNKKLSVLEVSKLEGCSKPTVINWIVNGVGVKKIKLKATRKGERDYVISGLDLVEFKRLKAA